METASQPRAPRGAELEVRVEVMQFEAFSRMFFQAHKQGEHVAIVGPTGSGKSVLALHLCRIIGQRKQKTGHVGRPTPVVVLGTKPQDSTLTELHKSGWPVIKKWPPAYGEEHCIIWPRNSKTVQGRAAQQSRVFEPVLDSIYVEGGQTVEINEAAYFERPKPKGLGLAATMEQFWSEARSNDNTLVAETQRPRHVSLLMWTEPSWVVIFKPEDERDLKTVAEASGRKNEVLVAVQKLGGFEFLVVRRQRDGGRGLYVSRVDRPVGA